MCSHRTYAVVGKKHTSNSNPRSQRAAHQCYKKTTRGSLWWVCHFPHPRGMANLLTPFLWFCRLLLLGIQISSFTQADLTSGRVQYIHSSETEKHSDAFSFTLSDGVNEVGEELASLLDGYWCSAIIFDWRVLSHRCCENFIPLCPQPRTEAKRTLILPERTHFWVPSWSVMPGMVWKGMQRVPTFSSGGCWGQVTHLHFSAI